MSEVGEMAVILADRGDLDCILSRRKEYEVVDTTQNLKGDTGANQRIVYLLFLPLMFFIFPPTIIPETRQGVKRRQVRGTVAASPSESR